MLFSNNSITCVYGDYSGEFVKNKVMFSNPVTGICM